MAFNFLKTKLSILPNFFQASFDAIFSTIPFSLRWRLLLLQPINILSTLITSPSWLFNNRSTVLYVPTRSGSKRCLVYHPRKGRKRGDKGNVPPRPLHIDFHGGGFIGGFPEQNARWCALLSDETGAVVVSCSYRFAPRHPFPAAHDDADDIVSWLISHASDLDADPNILTVGGSSAGGNLALSTAQFLESQVRTGGGTHSVVARGFVGFYTPVNFHLKPQEKPVPPNYPKNDPLSFLIPMFDSYAGPNRARDWNDPRLHPYIADVKSLPRDILFIVAAVDILAHEQLTFVERLKRDIAESKEEVHTNVEARVWDKGFHAWLERESR